MKKTKILLLAIFIIALGINVVNAQSQYSTLYVETHTGGYLEWDDEVNDPYLDDDDASYIHEAKSDGERCGEFNFADLNSLGSIDNVTVYFRAYGDDTNDQIYVLLNGTNRATITINQGSYSWFSADLSTWITTEGQVNGSYISLTTNMVAGGDDIWIDRMYLYVGHSYVLANNAPINNYLSMKNQTDTDNLYSEYKWYHFRSDHEDLDGWNDINNVKLYVNQSSTSRAIFNYDNTSGVFSVVSGNWELKQGNVTHDDSLSMNISWYITPSWDAVEESDIEYEVAVFDGEDNDHDVNLVQNDDVITTLLTSSIECVDANNPDRTNINVNTIVDATVRYINNPASGTPSSFYPPDAEFTSISLYDSSDNVEATDTSVVNGVVQFTGWSESTVQSETYNLYINMNDVDYTDGELSTTEQIIWDRIIITGAGVTDDRTNINEVETFWFTAELDYDAHVLGSGDSLVMEGSRTFTWDGVDSRWEYDNSESTAIQILIDAHQSAYETTYGISQLFMDGNSASIIWDRIIITYLDIYDGYDRFQAGDLTQYEATAELEYDGHVLGTGDTFILFNQTFTWNGTGFDSNVRRYQYQSLTLNTWTSGSEVTYGITAGSINGHSNTVIFDEIWCTLFIVDDSTPENNVNVTFTLEFTSPYDSYNFTNFHYDIDLNGTRILNDYNQRTFKQINTSVTNQYRVYWWGEFDYGLTNYTGEFFIKVRWSTLGIPNEPSMNYALVITDMDDTDNLYSEKKYYNLDYDGYDEDGYANVSHIIIYINQSATSRAVFHYDEDTDTFSLVSGDWELDIGNCVATRSGTDLNLTFKITPSWDAIEESDIELEATINDGASNDHDIMQTDYADVVTNLLVTSFECVDTSNPDRTNLGTGRIIEGDIRYADNPSSSVGSDDYPLNGEFNGWYIWNATHELKGIIVGVTNGYISTTINSPINVKGDTYHVYLDIDDVDYTDGHEYTSTEFIIWDRIKILTLGVDDGRIDTGSMINGNTGYWYLTAELEYDNEALGFGDNVLLNPYCLFEWNGTHLRGNRTNIGYVGMDTLNAFTSGVSNYGITVGNINGLSSSIIWDRLVITFIADDSTPNDGQTVKFTVDIEYDYDNVNVTTYEYDIKRNGTLFKDDWILRAFTDTQNAPTKYIYNISEITESTYDLTSVVFSVEGYTETVQWITVLVVGDVNLLFGVGYNHTTPYVYIMWNYTGDVDNYEIYHSTDNITYLSLVLTPNKYYNHTSLVNGSYHYYKVRSTYYTDAWQNSSFSPINLERVWFIHGGGGGVVGSTIGLFNNFIIMGILSLIAVVGNKVRMMK